MSKGANIKFSVVIPAYNAGKTIARAITSVLAQSYPAHEIIVVDDSSKDDTVDLVEQYPAIRLIRKIKNQGSSAARNAGLDAATGDYIAFLDADDIWHEHKLMLVNTILSSRANINFFFHRYTLQPIGHQDLPEDIKIYKLPFIRLLFSNSIATPCAIMINDPSFRFEPSMRFSEDYDLWLRLAYKYRAYFIDVPLTQISRPVNAEGGISSNKWAMRKGEMRAYSRLTRLNPLFVLLLPFLLLCSMGKHLFKKITG